MAQFGGILLKSLAMPLYADNQDSALPFFSLLFCVCFAVECFLNKILVSLNYGSSGVRLIKLGCGRSFLLNQIRYLITVLAWALILPAMQIYPHI